jgi:hypothetical protein
MIIGKIKRGVVALLGLAFLMSPLTPLLPLLEGHAAADTITPTDLGSYIPVGISACGDVTVDNSSGTGAGVWG